MVNQDKNTLTVGYEDGLQAYFDDIRSNPLLSFEEELELSRRIEKGDKEANDRLVQSNLRLVIKIAKQYLCPGVTLLDLVQEGNLGLLQAASKYDYRRQVRFSTYASWWIRQSITRALANKKRSIRLPHRKEDLLKKVQASYNVLSQRLMRKPTVLEIAEFLDIPREDVISIMSLNENVMSLDSEILGDGGTLYDLCLDYSYAPDKAFMSKMVKEAISRLIDKLTERERSVLRARYGLEGAEKATLKEIAEALGVSPETVRQIEMRSIRKLRELAADMKDILMPAV